MDRLLLYFSIAGNEQPVHIRQPVTEYNAAGSNSVN